MTTNKDEVKIAKNKLLNWLYAESINISVKKLGYWLEENTNGRYKLVDTQKQEENVKDSTR
ncbi:MAG: hypothetical protein LCH20_02680 [Proteobacteria bacterium]|nr:hypothetical protein [Pseudomonadota bacterium]